MLKINRFPRTTIGAVLIGLMCVLWGWSKKRTVAEDDLQTANTQQLMVSSLLTLGASGDPNDEKMLAGLLTLLRGAIDVEVYPPVQPRETQPVGLIGGWVMASVLTVGHQQPQRLDRWIEALEQWSPKFPPDYSPGWEFSHVLSQGERSKIVAKHKASVLDQLRRIRRTACTPDEAKLANEINKLKQEREQTWQEQSLAERYNDDQKAAQLASRKNELNTLLKQRQMKYADLRFHRLKFARWHAAAELDAQEFFDDPLVVRLCRAIEADDIAAMTKAIDDGANINALGKYGVTPLFWSLPDNRLNRFELLILHGADPTIRIDVNWMKDWKHLNSGRTRKMLAQSRPKWAGQGGSNFRNQFRHQTMT
ncbi:hypothetical protein Q31b_14100 [Novipirellula aureliae]|uniref:Uncharacterized protein n=1 Tax=Novipirellula aureliae TaxID=2527966 RepID=A0A5C6E4N9_9BACT|nr:hypothetical protein [Novipirellula aureliae]TWU43878.1 hypothetical protein Q31b_14100 [Novipirellula aureliae]